MKVLTLAPERDLREWHRWFAWRPVLVDRTWVWLETVERRLFYSYACTCRYYRFPPTLDLADLVTKIRPTETPFMRAVREAE